MNPWTVPRSRRQATGPNVADGWSSYPRVVDGIDSLSARDGRLFIVIGVFDGLHLGHQYLLRELGVAARERGARAAVVTFDHHPDEILIGTAPPLLCDPAERLDLLAEAGVDLTIVQTFDSALRLTAYDVFIGRIAEHVDVAGFLMTPDAAFGNERRGTPQAVAALGQVLGFDVVVVPSLDLGGRPVRSSEIRTAIAAGDLVGAARMLGRPYAVRGIAEDLAAGSMRVRFAMPVALPPAGDHRVVVEADLDGRPEGDRTVAVVQSDGTLVVTGNFGGVPPGAIRVTFGS